MAVDFDFPSQAVIRQGRRDGAIVDSRDAAELAHHDKIAAALEIMNARRAEESDALDHFVEMAAEFFGCSRMTERNMRGRLKMSFDELRQLASDLGPSSRG